MPEPPALRPPPLRVGSVTLRADDDAQARHEKLARVVLDAMYQFVGLLDAEGRTLEINRAALDGAGVDLEQIRGKPFWEARWFQVSRETIEQQRDFVRRAGAGEFIRCDLEVYGQAAGDETIVVDFSLLPVRDAEGRVAFLLAEGRNITAKKRAEAEVARKTAELQALLDKVRRLDQMRSELFANVSHELRTPLALILGPAEDMLEAGGSLAPEQRRQLQVIRRSASTLLRQVNDLLDLARLDERKMDLSLAQVDLAALVRTVAEQFHALAPQRALSYHVSTPPVLVAAVDADKIERVLLNLLSNAFKFTPPGGRVRCTLSALAGGRCLLAVQDSGPGVPEALRPLIFERFRQGQQGTTRAWGGSGLGLSIAREFVEMHHGSLGVTDAPGSGALFQVELPLVAPPGAFVAGAPLPGAGPASAGVLAELEPPPEDEALPPPEPDRATILLVEDNAGMRRLMRDALSGDYRVVALADGQRALAQAEAEPPDLVVTDLMLPGLGGDHLVEAMRATPRLAEVLVLVVSARDDDALRARLLARAAQDYLTKPFSAHELRARVRNLVTMKRARDALRRELLSQSSDLTHLTRHLIASRRALQESEQRWWAVYEHSPVGVALIDAEGRVRSANPAFRDMLGYSAQEMRRCRLAQITPAEDREAMQQRMQRLLAGELRDYHVQRRYLRADGAAVWTRTSVALVPDPAHDTPMLVVVAEDITEQRQAETALAGARRELARVSRASTLGELAASIAHEVNQPLAAIAANGQAAQRWLDAQPPNEDEARAALGRVSRDATRAGEIINRIRAFLTRGETPRLPVDLGALVADVLQLVHGEAQQRGIALWLEPPPPCAPVLADRVQVQQVVLNLVINALEAIGAAGEGPRQVALSLHPQDGEALRLSVCDSGTGLPPDAGERLFQAFHTTKPDGMGMGLAISRSIIESHGGRLWAEPNRGRGATFHFTLPLAAVEPA